jgi:hypothetical protein
MGICRPRERPLVPHRVENAALADRGDLKPVLAGNFLMVPQPTDVSRGHRVVFAAAPAH